MKAINTDTVGLTTAHKSIQFNACDCMEMVLFSS